MSFESDVAELVRIYRTHGEAPPMDCIAFMEFEDGYVINGKWEPKKLSIKTLKGIEPDPLPLDLLIDKPVTTGIIQWTT